MMDLFDLHNPMASLDVALNGLFARNKAISGNIANVNTPGYKSEKTSFEDELARVQAGNKTSDIPLRVTNPKHLSNEIFNIADVKPKTTRDFETEVHANGNNVDIDAEMLRLTKTGMQFKAIAELSKRQFQDFRDVIKG